MNKSIIRAILESESTDIEDSHNITSLFERAVASEKLAIDEYDNIKIKLLNSDLDNDVVNSLTDLINEIQNDEKDHMDKLDKIVSTINSTAKNDDEVIDLNDTDTAEVNNIASEDKAE